VNGGKVFYSRGNREIAAGGLRSLSGKDEAEEVRNLCERIDIVEDPWAAWQPGPSSIPGGGMTVLEGH
jgi:hypothetical protein